MNNLIISLLWLRHNNNDTVLSIPPIIHGAGAFTDTDEIYGAYVAAESNTFNITSNSNSDINSNSHSYSHCRRSSRVIRKTEF